MLLVALPSTAGGVECRRIRFAARFCLGAAVVWSARVAVPALVTGDYELLCDRPESSLYNKLEQHCLDIYMMYVFSLKELSFQI